MSRKIAVIISISLLVVVIGAAVVFAAEQNNSKSADFIKSMFDFMRDQTNNAQKEGQITQEEAEEWNRHLDDMEKYHEENGFSQHCGDFEGKTSIPDNQNYSPRSGMGMMDGYYNGEMMGNYDI